MKILGAMTALVLLTASPYPVFAAGAEPVQTVSFFESIEDMPLMPGLEELPEHTLSFDKPEGQITEAYAVLENVSEEDVRKYYTQSLPQFGWGKMSANRFFRAQEYLVISFETIEGQKFVKFLIRPSL